MTPGFLLLAVVTSNFNILWLILYALVIRRGFIDKTFGIPAVALCVNFTWDVISSLGGETAVPMPQPLINGTYALIDIVIIYQVLRFWRSDFGDKIPARQFYLFFGLSLIFSFILVWGFIQETNDFPTLRAGFASTFMTSAMFIGMFYRRPKLEGQSLYIALCKLFGSGPFMLVLPFINQMGVTERVGFEYPSNSALLIPLMFGTFLFDLIYAVLVYQRCRELGINPWRRF